MQPIFRAIVVSLLALAPAAAAVAAEAAPAAPAANSPTPASALSIGAGIGYLPEYAGADDMRTVAMISFDYANKNGFFASTRRGIGYHTSAGPVQLSAALGYDHGRKESGGRLRYGSDTLRGMGDVKGAALAKLGVGYDFGFMTVGVEANLALSNRERGNSVEFAVGVPLLVSATDKVALVGSADFGDSKYMQTYYGVTAQQSARSQFAAYTPSAGFQKVSVGVNWGHKLSASWSFQGLAGAFTMVGDAKDSPLTKRSTTPVVLATFKYSF